MRKAAKIPITQIGLDYVKELRKKTIIKQIEEDPTLGEDKDQDHNNIENLLMINYCLKTIKMIIVMTSISYFMGIIWYIYCDLTRRVKLLDYPEDDRHPANSFVAYNFDWLSPGRVTIILTYFSFTTLATIGMGDYHPNGNQEWIFSILIMMTGVIVFSLVMNIFVAIILQIQNLSSEIDEGDELRLFFSLLKKFNQNVPIDY